MDPFTALSVAGTVVQFVDFSIKLLSTTRKLYHSVSGSLPAHEELEYVTIDISRLAGRLQRPVGEGGAQASSPELLEICSKCAEVAQELLKRLAMLKVDKKAKAWQIFRAALKESWTREDLNELVTRLSIYKQSIQAHILAELREQIASISLSQNLRFDTLDSRLQHTITSLLNKRNSNSNSMEARDQTMAVAQMLNRTENMISNQHKATRAMIINAIRKYEYGISRTAVSKPEDILETSMKTDELKLKFDVEASILESLCFSTISTRYEEVAEAHRSTFKWLFQDFMHDEHAPRWDSFTNWLRGGDKIYWINGKAASGKSTLMRYIYDHPTTRKELRVWAGPTRLTVAGFFFWNSGTSEQRSQLGLLRSLLFRILQQYQELIPVVLPWLWAKRYSQALDPYSHHEQETLTLSKLMEAFQILTQQASVSVKLCLFIDGLDEFDGDHSAIAQLFVNTAESPNVKLCLSSRPLIEFEDTLNVFPGLRLQDLTVGDIRNYVNDNLKLSQRYQRLSLREPTEAPALVEEIVNKADGVFLWVKLVVESLLKGLGKRDDVSDLRQRLRLLPADLEKLYQLMLNRIEPIYMGRVSIMFQILREAQETDEAISILAFALANDPNSEDMLFHTTQAWDELEVLAYCKEMEDRLKSHSAGLLEVSGYDANSLGPTEATHKVQYLHRTVRDYLEKPDVWVPLIHGAYPAHSEFHPSIALLRACVLQLKIVNYEKGRRYTSERKNCGNAALRFASRAEHYSSWNYNPIMADLYMEWALSYLSAEPFLHHVISHDLVRYADEHLSKQSRGVLLELLSFALEEHKINGGNPEIVENTQTSVGMFEVLLKHGADPNEPYRERPAFEELIFMTLKSIDQRDVLIKLFPIIKVFLKHNGIKPGARVATNFSRPIPGYAGAEYCTAAQVIRQAFDTYVPPDAEEILSMLDEKEHDGKPANVAKPRTPIRERFKRWSFRKSISRS